MASLVTRVQALLPLWVIGLSLVVALSFCVLYLLVRPAGAWGRRVRSRFLLGVPWGTLTVALGVAAVFLLLQRGWWTPADPLVVPFRAWSYTYPLGMLTAPFSHASIGHLTGNLLGTLTFGVLAEYAWSHFPTERGSQSFGSLRENPVVRVGVFVGAVTVVALLTSLFAVGPVIGFSGAVFAVAGFALVYYPIPTVVALTAGDLLNLLYRALLVPVDPAQAGPRFVTPWWANVAIQGHAIGFLYGVVLGAFVLSRRDRTSDPTRLWAATLLFAVGQSLWAVYWFRGGSRYVLFRAGGTMLVFLLAALVTAALTASNRPLIARIDLRRREAAVGLLLSLTLALSLVGVPTNLIAVDDAGFDDGVEVRDYTVAYAEDVTDQYVSAFDVGLFGTSGRVNTSGVILLSERRDVFNTVVPKSQLGFAGDTTVQVGGLGWRREVGVNLTVWRPVGNDSAYRVALDPPDGPERFVYGSNVSTAEPRIDGRRVRFRPMDGGFLLVVTRDAEPVGRVPLPDRGRNVSAGGLRFNRTADHLYAMRGRTRVRVAAFDGG
ncbi:MAG: rhomboid family intramembrane serine protease [Halorientalis sp.]